MLCYTLLIIIIFFILYYSQLSSSAPMEPLSGNLLEEVYNVKEAPVVERNNLQIEFPTPNQEMYDVKEAAVVERNNLQIEFPTPNQEVYNVKEAAVVERNNLQIEFPTPEKAGISHGLQQQPIKSSSGEHKVSKNPSADSDRIIPIPEEKNNQGLTPVVSRTEHFQYQHLLEPTQRQDYLSRVGNPAATSTSTVTNNTQSLPQPQLYRFGFISADPHLLTAAERVYAADSTNKDKTYSGASTMAGHSVLMLSVVCFASGLAVTVLASALFILYRRWSTRSRQSQADDVDELKQPQQLVQVVGADMCAVLNAMPTHLNLPLSNDTPLGLGQQLLLNRTTTTSTPRGNNTHSPNFINEFSDVTGRTGGRIEHPASDVAVHIPPGAFSAVQQVSLRVYLSAEELGALKENEYQLSPVAEVIMDCVSSEDVVLQIPHSGGANAQLSVKYTHQLYSNQRTWAYLDKTSYHLDSDFLYVKTSQQGKFVVVADKASTFTIKMSISAWSNMNCHGQKHYRIYCHHANKDIEKRVHEMEQVYGGQPVKSTRPLMLEAGVQIDITLHCATSTIKKALSIEGCVECYDPPSYVDMTMIESAAAGSAQPIITYCTKSMDYPVSL